jgi:hypothetical protein
MATIGQCKACKHGVSDEAATCPNCGQPNPCVLLPSVGSVHEGRIVTAPIFDDHNGIMSVAISSGIIGVLQAPYGWSKQKSIGDIIKVTVVDVDSQSGDVDFSLSE